MNSSENLLQVLFLFLFVFLIIIYRALDHTRLLMRIKRNIVFDKFAHAIGLSVEAGTCIHLSLGTSVITSEYASSGLVGLSVLKRLIRVASNSDRPPVVLSGDATLSILSQDTIQSVRREYINQPQSISPVNWLVGFTPFSYAAGSLPAISDDLTSVDVFLGHFGIEVGLMLDASERKQNISLAGSGQLNAQAIIYAAAQLPLLGEELYSAGAYMRSGGLHVASLHAEDIMRWILIGIILAGAFLKFIGAL